ncbi:V-set and immunoglobulin domain-containing protein 10 isoform X2 [Antechinus flavipes]|uniref:V-set and immunoglobulin domain-containing protein 10 isoform X1 n=1 Tax=Antechinus flavipes TaxID=38775 RepID=UPI002235ED37|nr:V-set and immunoglobulin domain-containing protein 10 isoform X1 [Antechinus flavipes]XP_051828839.1 V-set and immunoglobulin domain-containing protein 10 isoform X2 [Antechinus flavipes]
MPGGRALAPLPLLLLLLCEQSSPSRVPPETQAVIIGEEQENVTLPCSNTSNPGGLVSWYRNEPEAAFLLSSNTTLPRESRYSLVNGSSLRITGLGPQDEGNYTCREVLNETLGDHLDHRIQLLVASGPNQISVKISPTGIYPNGSLFVTRGSTVTFNCSSSSHPPPVVEWYFQMPGSNREPFGTNNENFSYFELHNMSPSLQGNYTCFATNTLSKRVQKVTSELLVYYPPWSAPQCWAETVPSGSMLQLICRWSGGYPDPVFLWTEEPGNLILGNSTSGVEILNRSQLSDGKKFKCIGNHTVASGTMGANCVVQINGPTLQSEPMKTCFLGGNVTLTCQVSGANPAAKISWLRNLTQPEEEILPSARYLITHEDSVSTLTILNCSQGVDEGYYVCRAENPVRVREVDIWLTVKKPLNIGGIVGAVVILLLLGVGTVSGFILYYSPNICLKVGSSLRGQDTSDVMVLVDSQDEEEEDVEEEEEEREEEDLPKEITRHGHIHRVTALVNGDVERMGNGLQALQGQPLFLSDTYHLVMADGPDSDFTSY